MRKFLFILLCVSVSFLYAQQKYSISQDEAWKIVSEEVLNNKIEGINVYVSNCPAKNIIRTIAGEEISSDTDSWFFFIDDMPMESWEHPCRYVFVNSTKGQLTVINKRTPPMLSTMKNIVTHKVRHSDETQFNLSPDFFNQKGMKNSMSIGNNYAVIINGGIDAQYNHERYWNHCSAVYQTLVYLYGVPKSHIYVLMSDGTDPAADMHMISGLYQSSPLDLDGDGLADIQYAATRANIASVFNTLSNTLTSNDNLFVFTTDHGGQTSGQQSYLCLWNYETLYDYEFANYISQVNANNINLCLVQCHSGGFIDNLTGNNIVVSTSCRYDENAYAMDDLRYSEFLYYWVSAVAGETPDGIIVNADSDNNGFVSIREAFEYASANDTQNEHPQYLSRPSNLGLEIIATGSDINISGPTIPCSQETYQVENLPSGCTVNWTWAGSGLTVDSIPILVEPYYSTNNYLKLNRSNLSYAKGVITANIQQSGATIGTLTKTIDTGAYFYGTWYQGSATASTLACGASYNITDGSSVVLQSADFMDATATYTSNDLLLLGGLSHSGNTISFTPIASLINPMGLNAIDPDGLGNSVTIHVKNTTTCETFKFMFTILTHPTSGTLNLNINSSGSEYTFSLDDSQPGESNYRASATEILGDGQTWNLEIVELESGEAVYNEQSEKRSITVNMSSQKSGIYVVVARIGNKTVATQKIAITNQ